MAIASPTVVPASTSSTPGERTAPAAVSSTVPAAPRRPADRYHSAPYLAMRAICASVSTFWTRVGAPSTPATCGRGGFEVGVLIDELTKFTTALDSPATYRAGAAT